MDGVDLSPEMTRRLTRGAVPAPIGLATTDAEARSVWINTATVDTTQPDEAEVLVDR